MSGPVDAPAKRTLTMGGLPGTGTTTACKSLAPALGLEYHYAGQIFRDMAAARSMTLAQFGELAEHDASIDIEIDRQQVDLLRGKPVLLEGRLAGFLAKREGLPAFKVWFHADPYTRARRVVIREGGTIEARMAEMREREASERTRYLQYYSYDPGDLSLYDLVLDTSKLTRLEVVEAVVAHYFAPPKRRMRWAFWRR